MSGEEQRLDTDTETTKGAEKANSATGNKTTPNKKTVSKPKKPFKEMTSEEHKAYMDSTGGVI